MQEIQSLNCFHEKKYAKLLFFLTMSAWKLDIFFIHFLREIKVGESRVSKSANLRNFEALNLDFHEFPHCLRTHNAKITNLTAAATLSSQIFRQINVLLKNFTVN